MSLQGFVGALMLGLGAGLIGSDWTEIIGLVLLGQGVALTTVNYMEQR